MLVHDPVRLQDFWRSFQARRKHLQTRRLLRHDSRPGHPRAGAILVPDVGERNLLDKLTGRGNATEDMILGLYRTDVTPAEADTLGTFTEANFTNYVQKTLTDTSWGAASTNTGTTSAAYAQQSWTCGSTGNTIYGALYIDTDTTTLIMTDDFASARVLTDTDILNFTPRIELA